MTKRAVTMSEHLRRGATVLTETPLQKQIPPVRARCSAHGVRDHKKQVLREASDVLSDEARTLAEVFREGGYETGAFIGNPYLAAEFGFSQGFDIYFLGSRDDEVIDHARSWLSSRASKGSYFAYLHLIDVHAPYQAPERDYLALKASPSLGEDRQLTPDDPKVPHQLVASHWADVRESARIRPWKAKYAAGVRDVDRRLGALLNDLRKSGELDRTGLVLTSDHGEEFLEHGTWEHGNGLNDNQLPVPLWVRAPSAASAGARVSSVVSVMDIMPTILSIASLPIPPIVQGPDRSRLVEHGVSTPEEAFALSTSMYSRPTLHAVRSSRYRLLWDERRDSDQLFDL